MIIKSSLGSSQCQWQKLVKSFFFFFFFFNLSVVSSLVHVVSKGHLT